MSEDFIKKKIGEAENRVQELLKKGDLRKITEKESYQFSQFFENKSLARLETAKIIFSASQNSQSYCDFSETVSAAYYAMYYTVHAFLAKEYQRKVREGLRGVHAITLHLIVYYLIKTEKLAKHLYEEYCTALEAAAEIQAFQKEEYQEKAFSYARNYQQQREKREQFTYFVSKNAEQSHAKQALEIAEEFISTIRELMS